MLDLDLRSLTGTAFRQQIFPERRTGPFRLTFTTGSIKGEMSEAGLDRDF